MRFRRRAIKGAGLNGLLFPGGIMRERQIASAPMVIRRRSQSGARAYHCNTGVDCGLALGPGMSKRQLPRRPVSRIIAQRMANPRGFEAPGQVFNSAKVRHRGGNCSAPHRLSSTGYGNQGLFRFAKGMRRSVRACVACAQIIPPFSNLIRLRAAQYRRRVPRPGRCASPVMPAGQGIPSGRFSRRPPPGCAHGS